MSRFPFLALSVVIAFLCGSSLAAMAGSYEGTTKEVFHGFLIVIADDCTSHNLVESSTVFRTSLDAWGSTQHHVHVESRMGGNGIESAVELSPSLKSTHVDCRSKIISRNHVSGTMQNWSAGNAIGSFDVVDGHGARFSFDFATRDLHNTTRNLKRTSGRVRVDYEVKDSPQGPIRDIVSITSI